MGRGSKKLGQFKGARQKVGARDPFFKLILWLSVSASNAYSSDISQEIGIN
jgi:hypothetical protein